MDRKRKVVFTIIILFALVAIFYFTTKAITKYTGYSITGKAVFSDEEKEELAECLSSKSVQLYCVRDSIYCKTQISLFGEGFEHIDYIDCSKTPRECAGIKYYPAWKINKEDYYGIKDLRQLEELSKCDVR